MLNTKSVRIYTVPRGPFQEAVFGCLRRTNRSWPLKRLDTGNGESIQAAAAGHFSSPGD